MSVVYTCPTCGTPYDCAIGADTVSYLDGNKVIKLKNDNQDCNACMIKIKEAEEAERLRIKTQKNEIQETQI